MPPPPRLTSGVSYRPLAEAVSWHISFQGFFLNCGNCSSKEHFLLARTKENSESDLGENHFTSRDPDWAKSVFPTPNSGEFFPNYDAEPKARTGLGGCLKFFVQSLRDKKNLPCPALPCNAIVLGTALAAKANRLQKADILLLISSMNDNFIYWL